MKAALRVLGLVVAALAVCITAFCGLVTLAAGALQLTGHPVFDIVWGASSLLTAALAVGVLLLRRADD
jgi:hypothetical protein